MSKKMNPNWTLLPSKACSNLVKLNQWYAYNLDERYVGDKLGNVYSIKHTSDDGKYLHLHRMKPYTNKDGYLEFVLTNKDGDKKHIMNQIATKGIWDDRPENCLHVNHNDGNRLNNKLGNLVWMTISDNIKHSYRVLGRVVNRRGPAKK